MLRRKYKKMRNKRGGRTFLDAFTEGAGTIKKTTLLAKEKVERVGEDTERGFIAFKDKHKETMNRNITGGEGKIFDPFSTQGDKWLKENPPEKEYGAYTSHGNNHKIYNRPTKTNLQSISKKIENPEKFEAIKTVTFGGRRKTRKRKKRAGSYYLPAGGRRTRKRKKSRKTRKKRAGRKSKKNKRKTKKRRR